MYNTYNEGFVEVITGPMFAGKTETLMSRINTLSYANKKIEVFKPKIDNRYSEDSIASHSGGKIPCHAISNADDIYGFLDDDVEVVAIDEIQFFDESIIEVCDILAERGIRVMVAGLDMDFRGEPFPIMSHLITTAEFVDKLTAVCLTCGAPATRSQRLVNGEPAKWDDDVVVVGANESYEARCRHHHHIHRKV